LLTTTTIANGARRKINETVKSLSFGDYNGKKLPGVLQVGDLVNGVVECGGWRTFRLFAVDSAAHGVGDECNEMSPGRRVLQSAVGRRLSQRRRVVWTSLVRAWLENFRVLAGVGDTPACH